MQAGMCCHVAVADAIMVETGRPAGNRPILHGKIDVLDAVIQLIIVIVVVTGGRLAMMVNMMS